MKENLNKLLKDFIIGVIGLAIICGIILLIYYAIKEMKPLTRSQKDNLSIVLAVIVGIGLGSYLLENSDSYPNLYNQLMHYFKTKNIFTLIIFFIIKICRFISIVVFGFLLLLLIFGGGKKDKKT